MEINPRPGTVVCIGRWDGTILFYKPHAYDGWKQGDTPKWNELKRRNTDKRRGHRIERERRHCNGSSS